MFTLDVVLLLFYLHPSWALIDFYFLYGHHLTAFLALTLLILGIASLLASDVVLHYRPRIVWNSFISALLFFFVISLIPSRSVPRLLSAVWQFYIKLPKVSTSKKDWSWYRLSELHLFTFIVTKLSIPSPETLQTRSLLLWRLFVVWTLLVYSSVDELMQVVIIRKTGHFFRDDYFFFIYSVLKDVW